jgi:hypothetical protein
MQGQDRTESLPFCCICAVTADDSFCSDRDRDTDMDSQTQLRQCSPTKLCHAAPAANQVLPADAATVPPSTSPMQCNTHILHCYSLPAMLCHAAPAADSVLLGPPTPATTGIASTFLVQSVMLLVTVLVTKFITLL